MKEHQLQIKTKCFHVANDYWRIHELNRWKLLPGWLSLSQTKPGLTEKVWMPFLEGFKPEKLWQNLKPMTTELFYSHILNMSSSSFHTRRFRRKYLSGLICRLTKMALQIQKSSAAFAKQAPVLFRKGVMATVQNYWKNQLEITISTTIRTNLAKTLIASIT